MFLSSQLSTIVSQLALGVKLLSQAFKSASTDPSSPDPQKETISVETTNASKAAEDASPISPPDAAKALFLKFLIFIQFSPFLIICQFRNSLRKQSCKSRSPIVHLLTVIMLALSSRLLNPQSSRQLMVRKLYAWFIFLHQIWAKDLPWCLQIPMLKV